MLKLLLGQRPILPAALEVLPRLGPPAACPIASPFLLSARTAYLTRALPIQSQKPHTCQPRLRPRPRLRSALHDYHHHHHHPRPFSSRPQPPRDNNHNDPDPFSHRVLPSHHAHRLRAAKPLLTWRTLNSPRTYTVVAVAVAGALVFYFSNLETVPVSGRKRFNVYSADRVRAVGDMEYRRLLYDLEDKGMRVLPEWDPRTQRVRRVMRRLIPFSGLAGEDWEVVVVDAPRTANALVLPGGKVFVFSGILPLARNDSGLATVLGHEVAHTVADHIGERLSQDVGASIALYSLMVLGGAFGLGPLIVQMVGSRFLDVAFGLPMSRLQESEADYIGLMMMAEACYDPAQAVDFWARMEQAKGDQDVPEWMSTHPAHGSRIKKIQEWLPQAREKRLQSDCSSTTAFADLFRHALRTGRVDMV